MVEKVPETEQAAEQPTEDIVTAFEIEAATDAGIDYDKLIQQYGCFALTDQIKERFAKLTSMKAHRFLRRGIFFCHRELDLILNSYEKEKPFYLYTGRGPSAEALHLGHTIPFIFTKYLQDAFDVPLVIQITDDEKYIYRPELDLEGPHGTIQMGINNIKDIIAFGFDPEKTFIFSDVEYIKYLYPNVIRVQKHINFNQIKGIFGFNQSDAVGKFAFPPVQAVPAFSNTFPHIFGKNKKVPCLIPAAIDQDPYFRMTRDVAQKLKYEKPASLYSTFFPAMQGKKSKMSSSIPDSAILLTDTAAQIKKKINKFAKSGGGATVEEHRANGADLDVDVPFQYLTFFMEDDDKLEEIRQKYSKGELLTGEVKALLIAELQKFVADFQEKRKKVTNKDVEHFMSMRKMNPFPKKWAAGQKFIDEQKQAQAQTAQASSKAASGQAQVSSSAPASQAGKYTVRTDTVWNQSTVATMIASDLARAGARIEVVAKDQAKKGSFPSLQLADGSQIQQAQAIAELFARESASAGDLCGSGPFQEAQIQQFMAIAATSEAASAKVEQITFGSVKNAEQYKASVASLKETAKVLNGQLEGKKWLVGSQMTLADVFVFCALISAFQLIFDAGFRKAMPNLSEWFEKMSNLPAIARRAGFVKPCQKVVQPPQ